VANLTRGERRQWLDEFCRWQTPLSFSARVDDLWRERGDFLLTDPRAAFFREAHSAARFGRLRSANLVRLIAADRPDFELQIGSIIQQYEFTEADMPGRRRGQEIEADRAIASDDLVIRPFPSEEWLTPAMADQILRGAAAKKSSAKYDPTWGLLILLNPIEFGAFQAEIESVMRDATASAGRRFADVWVLWSGRAYHTWSAGTCQFSAPLSLA
jgi:hypothetical protein